MRPHAPALLVLASLLAGCLAPSPLDPATASPSAPAPEATTLAWRTADLRGDAAVRLTFAVEAAGSCTGEHGAASRREGEDAFIRYVGLVERDGAVLAWGGGGGGGAATARALGLVDSRSVSGSGGRVAGSGGIGFEAEPGEYRYVLVGLGLEPWEDSFLGNVSASFELSCAGPVRLARVEGSREAAILDSESAEGGAAARAFPAGGVSVATGGVLPFASPEVLVAGVSGFRSAGHVRVAEPGGRETTWLFTGEPGIRLATGGPGEWRVAADAFASPLFALGFVALGGFAPLPDLAALDAMPGAPAEAPARAHAAYVRGSAMTPSSAEAATVAGDAR